VLAVPTADASETLVKIAAPEKGPHRALDDRPPVAVLGLKAILVDLLERVKMLVHQTPQVGGLRIPRTVHSQRLDTRQPHEKNAPSRPTVGNRATHSRPSWPERPIVLIQDDTTAGEEKVSGTVVTTGTLPVRNLSGRIEKRFLTPCAFFLVASWPQMTAAVAQDWHMYSPATHVVRGLWLVSGVPATHSFRGLSWTVERDPASTDVPAARWSAASSSQPRHRERGRAIFLRGADDDGS